jgi:hypothetical protein
VDDFGARIDQLMERVGTGELVGMVQVDQIYAQAQHEHLDWNHPRGGQALYLQAPLMEKHAEYMQKIADGILDDGGKHAMEECVEDLAEEGGVATHAPILYANLRASGHPTVSEDGVTIYDRPPRQHRLTEEELRAIYRAHHPIPSKYSDRELRFLFSRGF